MSAKKNFLTKYSSLVYSKLWINSHLSFHVVARALTEGCFLASWYKHESWKKLSDIWELFYFFSFSFYGTSINIVPATAQDLNTILNIRLWATNHLKPLGTTCIQQNIQEFVLAIINGTPVGLMRLFTPLTAPHTLEMGSFVKITPAIVPWVSTTLIQYAEYQAMLKQKKVIAIVQNQVHSCLAQCLERKDWEDKSDSEEYSERLAESPGKQLWEKTPKRLDPDSKIVMYP